LTIIILNRSYNCDFHARYSALSKEYHYHILNRSYNCAVKRNYIWHIRQKLDIESMNQCCQIILGEHDFKSFEGSGSPRSHTIRTIYSAKIQKSDKHKIVFKIKGNGFLRFMVRNIVGTLVMAGHNKITPDNFYNILIAKDRKLAGSTAPASGLFLMNVNYI